MWGDITAEVAAEALDASASELLWECGITEPPVDALLVALRLGLAVTQDVALPTRAALVRLSEGQFSAPTAVVVLGDDQRHERQQFSMAHEVAEFAMPRVMDRLGLTPYDFPPGAREQLANRLAGRLLVPTGWLSTSGARDDWNLLALKAQFATASHELIARRMLDMPPAIVISVFDHGELTWRRANRRIATSGFLEVERQAAEDCHQLALAVDREDTEVDSGAVRVQCWPVHEPGWQREIMRTEILAWE